MAAIEDLGLTCAREAIAEQIQERVRAVAMAMGITEVSARREFTDDMIRAMARRIAEELQAEQPGSDPLELPRTHTVPIGLAGRTSAGLAIVAQLTITNSARAGVSVHQASQAIALIVSWGILTERSMEHPSVVAVPEALLHRTIRELGKAISLLDRGALPDDGGDPVVLRKELANNIVMLEGEL